ncbi:MAG: methyltransferase domain-containing protein, partial [Fibrobacteria bacterium]
CDYQGPFATKTMNTGPRINARCPKCGSLERHRIQHLVMLSLFNRVDFSRARMIHFAPEHFFRDFFRNRVGTYETADINPKGVDHQVDLRKLPFPDASYDLVFASHVLEHIDEDGKAISEIRRILGPKGIAVLPVPIVAEKTIEYPEANPFEEYHVRAPGLDYFDRYRPAFAKVDLHRSSDYPEKFQCYIYEDRSKWPTTQLPLLPTTPGERHADIIPVCYVSGKN